MLYDPKWEVPAETKPQELWRSLLFRAADTIEKHGLAKGRSQIGASYCTMGALQAHNYPVSEIMTACTRLQVFLHEPSIPAWNDEPDRTAFGVAAALRACAAE